MKYDGLGNLIYQVYNIHLTLGNKAFARFAYLFRKYENMDDYDFFDGQETYTKEKEEMIELCSWNIQNVDGNKDFELFLQNKSTQNVKN